MAILFLPISLFLLQVTVGFSQEQPGLKLRITRSGLDYGNQVASKMLNDQIRTLQIPDIDEGDIKAHDMRITAYNPPAFVYGLTPPSTLSWGITNAAITIEGKVQACKKVIVKICDTVDVKVSASGVSLQLTPKLGRSPDGHPTILTADTQVVIDHLDLDISGGVIGWIANLFSDKIADKLRSEAERKIADVGKDFLMNDANKHLATFEIQTNIGKYFDLDYGLLADPTVTLDYLEISVKGHVSLKGSPAVSPYPYTPLVSTTLESKMVFAWLSDKIVNDMGYFAHTANLTQHLITNDTDEIGPLLKVKCDVDQMCFGSLLPGVIKFLPPTVESVDVFLATTTPPTLRVHNGTTTLTVNGTMDFFAFDQNQTKISIALVQFIVEPQLTIQVEKLILVGQASISQLTMHVLEIMNPQMTKFFEKNLPALGKKILEKQINDRLKEGIPIPVSDGVEFLIPQIRLVEGTVQVDTDVNYTG